MQWLRRPIVINVLFIPFVRFDLYKSVQFITIIIIMSCALSILYPIQFTSIPVHVCFPWISFNLKLMCILKEGINSIHFYWNPFKFANQQHISCVYQIIILLCDQKDACIDLKMAYTIPTWCVQLNMFHTLSV